MEKATASNGSKERKKKENMDSIILQIKADSVLAQDDVDALELLLATEFELDKKFQDNNNLGHLAAKQDAVKCLVYLQEQGVNMHQRNDCGDTPVITAASEGALHAVDYLLGCGAELNGRFFGGGNVLFSLVDSCSKGHKVATFEYLISKGADIDHVNNMGTPFLHYATLWATSGLLRAAVETIDNPNCVDHKGRTALDYAEAEAESPLGSQRMREMLLANIEVLKQAGVARGTGVQDGDHLPHWRIGVEEIDQ